MGMEKPFLFALNGGMVSPLALARTDLTRMRISAEEVYNCFPRVIGPLSMRPGLGYLGSTKNDAVARNVPFIFNVGDTALLELTDLLLRVKIDGAFISRNAVSTVITNGDFNSSAGWTLTTTGGGVSDINGVTAGALTLQTPVRGGTALCKRSQAVSAPDQNVEHAIRLTVDRGEVRFRIGTTDGGQELLPEAAYATGVHSLVFTPTGATIYVQIEAESETQVIVSDLNIEAGGEFSLPTPWLSADLFQVRVAQSGDVIFSTHEDYQIRRIERRATRSWSIVTYKFKDGPFRGKTANVTLTPSVRLGNGTLTADKPFFTADMVGTLFQLSHTQTTASVSLAGNDVFTDPLRIAGLAEGTVRSRTYQITGVWVGTLTEQVSYDEKVTWQNRGTITANAGPTTGAVGSDNTIVYVRWGFQAGDYTSGTAVISLTQPGGGGDGVVRITSYTSATSVGMEVLSRLHHTGATKTWQEGKYSDHRGWPSSVALFEGRLWFGGADQLAGSYSDDFTNYNVEEEGDSAPIVRSVATGPVNKIQWMLDLARLIIGTSGAESVPRSNSFDEPMTVTNFSIKDASTYGSSDVQAVKIDRSGVFIHRSGKRAYDISYSVEANDYVSAEISRYNPTILAEGVKVMAVQRNPDTRVWFVLDDGSAVMLVLEKGEDVISWIQFGTDGLIEDVAVLPNTEDDDVYMIVQRTINGSTKRFHEKLAYDHQSEGTTANYMADSYIVVPVVASATVTGLSHLEGEDVVAWAFGAAQMTGDDPTVFTVTGGEITLDASGTGDVIVGLAYEGRWKSAKLAYGANTGTAMSLKKKINMVAPILYKTHTRGIKYGHSFTKLMHMPRMIRGVDRGQNAVLTDYDYDQFPIPDGGWDNDSRLCMQFRAPLPATVLGVGMLIEGHG